MLSFPGAGRGLGNNRVPIIASFFFNFFPFFFLIFKVFLLNYLSVATCSCLLLFFFRSLLVNTGKNICTLQPFASYRQ